MTSSTPRVDEAQRQEYAAMRQSQEHGWRLGECGFYATRRRYCQLFGTEAPNIEFAMWRIDTHEQTTVPALPAGTAISEQLAA